MSTHNIYFYGELKKIILELSSNIHHTCFSAYPIEQEQKNRQVGYLLSDN